MNEAESIKKEKVLIK